VTARRGHVYTHICISYLSLVFTTIQVYRDPQRALIMTFTFTRDVAERWQIIVQ